MIYADLPMIHMTQKLSMVSFSTPQKNLSVYKFVRSLEPLQSWLANEIVKAYDGKEELDADAKARLDETLAMPVSTNIEILELNESDFENENCRFPIDSGAWMSANDIKTIFEFLKKLEKEKGRGK